MRYWIGLGKAMAVDLDDDYLGLPRSNPAYPFWHENSEHLDPPPLVMLEKGIQIANALLSPNRNILQDWAHVGKGYYLPNYARAAWWIDLPTRAEQQAKLGLTNKIVIGWGGSVSHYDSWWGSGLREAAVDICRQFPQVVWLICGNDARIYEQLDVPIANKQYQPGVAPEDWPKVVKAFDIGVAPLAGTFDQRRSWIKTLEYGLAGVPWLASAGEPYQGHAGLGQLIPPGANAWTRALRTMIRNLDEEQKLADARVDFYRQWLMQNQMPNLQKIYTAIIANSVADHGQLPGVYWVNWDSNKSSTVTPVAIVPDAVSDAVLDAVPDAVSDETIVTEEVVVTTPDIVQPTPEELALVNFAHLQFIEHNTAEITIGGVDILKASAYDLIQLLNHQYLKALPPAIEAVNGAVNGSINA